MDEKWFCRIGEREFGPLLIAQLQRLSTRGQLTAESPVRRQDSDVWITAAEIPTLQSYVSGTGDPIATARSPIPPPPSVEDQINLPIVTQHRTIAKKASGAGFVAVSRGMLAALFGLGGVVAILLVAILVVLLRGEGQVDREGAADRQDVTKNTHVAAVPAKVESTTGLDPANAQAGQPLVDGWSKVTSMKVISNIHDGTNLCLVRINSIWASDDPTGADRTITESVARAVDDVPDDKVSDDEVLDFAALGVTRKKRVDATGKIIDPGPEPKVSPERTEPLKLESAKDVASFRYLFIELSLANTSADRSLKYLGWNGDGESTAKKDARLYDQDDNPCLFVSHVEAPIAGRRQQVKVAPGETIVDVLLFELPAGGFESLRLVLPQAAFGLTGNLGFEFAKNDMKLDGRKQ